MNIVNIESVPKFLLFKEFWLLRPSSVWFLLAFFVLHPELMSSRFLEQMIFALSALYDV